MTDCNPDLIHGNSPSEAATGKESPPPTTSIPALSQRREPNGAGEPAPRAINRPMSNWAQWTSAGVSVVALTFSTFAFWYSTSESRSARLEAQTEIVDVDLVRVAADYQSELRSHSSGRGGHRYSLAIYFVATIKNLSAVPISVVEIEVEDVDGMSATPQAGGAYTLNYEPIAEPLNIPSRGSLRVLIQVHTDLKGEAAKLAKEMLGAKRRQSIECSGFLKELYSKHCDLYENEVKVVWGKYTLGNFTNLNEQRFCVTLTTAGGNTVERRCSWYQSNEAKYPQLWGDRDLPSVQHLYGL